jgi:hypothetical protein
MTAILREASDPAEFPQHQGHLAAIQSLRILDAWQKAADLLARSPFPKFQQLGKELKIHLQHEQEFVTVFTKWGSAFSSKILPVLEYILENELLPEYQRNLVVVYPRMAQAAALDAARLNGDPDYGREKMHAALWRSNGQLVGDPSNEAVYPTIPAVDPVQTILPDQPTYLAQAKSQRTYYVRHYLNEWNQRMFQGLDYLIPFSKFKDLWFQITCGRLQKVMDENENRNFPFQIRKMDAFEASPKKYNPALEDNYIFVGTVYWKKVPEMMPRVFRSATENDSMAYAEVHVFMPKPRLVWRHFALSSQSGGESSWFGPLSENVSGETIWAWIVARQNPDYFPPNTETDGFPTNWNLFCQNWMCQLAPATQAGLDIILQTSPQMEYVESIGDINLPTLGQLKSQDIQKISPH